ncbi:MAG: DDE-type integrase/transposase/recombinase [Phycisphaerales bacterium]
MGEHRTVWGLVDSVSILFIQGYTAARARAYAHAMPMVRLLAERDHAHGEAVLLERELEIFRSQRRRKPPKQRSHYSPKERAEILQLMRLRGWSVAEAAKHFIVHPNTIRNWQKAIKDKHRAEALIGAPPWNKLHSGIRWLVHEIRTMCPERDFGTRTIARHLMRAGIQISRASVKRILEEEKPDAPRSVTRTAEHPHSSAPGVFYKPPRPNFVWNLDLTTVRVLWLRCEIAAAIDGFSRKIVGMRAYTRRPGTDELVEFIDEAVGEHGSPRFIVTDRGGQFQKQFKRALSERRIVHAKCQVRRWQFNAKVERLFWSLKRWWRVSLMAPSEKAIQKRLDAYAAWHNLHRPHAALGTLTPAEALRRRKARETQAYLERSDCEPQITVRRVNVRGDPRLPRLILSVRPAERCAA